MQPKDCLRCGCTDMMISVCTGAACAVGARDSRDEAGGEAAPRIAPLDSRRTGGGNAAWWLRRARDHCPPATDSLSVAGGHRRRLLPTAGRYQAPRLAAWAPAVAAARISIVDTLVELTACAGCENCMLHLLLRCRIKSPA